MGWEDSRMRNILIVGLTGLAQHGKSTAAKHLQNELGFQEYAFADKLKEVCIDLFNLDPSQIYTNEGKTQVDPRYGVTPRTILQHIGTEGFRKLYPTIWRDYVLRQIKESTNHQRFVISDVRFEDEAEGITALGGKIVKIVREGYQALSGEEAAHESEQFAQRPDSDFEYVIRAPSGHISKIQAVIGAIALHLLAKKGLD